MEDWEREEWRKRAKQIRIRIHWKRTLKNIGKAETRARRGQEL